MIKNEQSILEPLPLKEKLLYITVSLLLALMAIDSISDANTLTFDIFYRTSNGSYYVEASKMGGWVILGFPALLSISLMGILRSINKLNQKRAQYLGKIFASFAVLSIFSALILWPIINHQLDKHNYSYCFFYTGSNMFSPPVYVKDSSYCFKGARSVTDELFAWFDEQEAAGVELTPLEVKQKIDALKEQKGTDW